MRGSRWLITKHSAVAVLRRLHARQRDISALSFETLFEARVPQMLFRFSDGYQPQSFVGTFRRLMRDSGLLLSNDGQARTLYSMPPTNRRRRIVTCYRGGGVDTQAIDFGSEVGSSKRLKFRVAMDRSGPKRPS